MKRVGILGGGQLGLMTAEAVRKLGARVHIYDKDSLAPALFAAEKAYIGSWTDEDLLTQFFENCDVVTYEFENIETPVLKKIAEKFPGKLKPSLSVLEITQNRTLEKQFLRQHRLPCADFKVVQKLASIRDASSEFGFPFVLKRCVGGYDGKGQWLVESESSLRTLLESFNGNEPYEYVLEDFLPLSTEASVIVARQNQKEVCFPVMENIHQHHILAYTLCPSRLPGIVQDRMQALAVEAARKLDIEGLLTVEFFLTKDKPRLGPGMKEGDYHIFINEFAPRPHNSGHLTRNACAMSQFDALARILVGVPLTSPDLLSSKTFCMGNLLGDIWLTQGRSDLSLKAWKQNPHVVEVFTYGKIEPKPQRKMGHFTLSASGPDEALNAAKFFKQALREDVLKPESTEKGTSV
jgi:5-(carboxyamino)imidazole ribonucleotide synthase